MAQVFFWLKRVHLFGQSVSRLSVSFIIVCVTHQENWAGMFLFRASVYLILVSLFLSATGQEVDKSSRIPNSETDADMQAAEEAVRIADQVSQDSELPQDTAPVTNDSDTPQETAPMTSDSKMPQDTAPVSSDSEMPHETAPTTSDSQIPPDTAPLTSDADTQDLDDGKDLEEGPPDEVVPDETSQEASFLDAKVNRTARSLRTAKARVKPHISVVEKKGQDIQYMKTHASDKKVHWRSQKEYLAWMAGKQPALQSAVDAANAHTASETAKEAAKVANQIARHSVHLSEHAKDALKGAQHALHKARSDTQGLSKDQKESLSNAEARLKEATKATEYGAVKDARYAKMKAANGDLDKLQDKLENTTKKNSTSELAEMREDLKQLREQLEAKTGGKEGVAKDEEEALKELEAMLKQLEEEEAAGKESSTSHDELKVEIGKLRDAINRIEIQELTYTIPDKAPAPTEKVAPPKKVIHELPEGADEGADVPKSRPLPDHIEAVTPTGGIDTDTMMPYGDLEPFGREDTAQELTEASIKESDAMVDQLERAEVAEEKRAVFRALTRLRGAAITSFDGVARSQTGNIDEYNKIHKWRNTHPLHHLADEESDISKWAFPDNADF
mmetsp:Transcript_138759/g.239886  ORF Transcript_138759/g.239886 Transcript_138759/m.239886 type:complete len:617 (+) Transcript_138759:3-1853(+)